MRPRPMCGAPGHICSPPQLVVATSAVRPPALPPPVASLPPPSSNCKFNQRAELWILLDRRMGLKGEGGSHCSRVSDVLDKTTRAHLPPPPPFGRRRSAAGVGRRAQCRGTACVPLALSRPSASNSALLYIIVQITFG